jgi:hypothetical protein
LPGDAPVIRNGFALPDRGRYEALARPVAGLLHRGKTSSGMLERMRRICGVRPVLPPGSAFEGFRFPREVIVLAVHWFG